MTSHKPADPTPHVNPQGNSVAVEGYEFSGVRDIPRQMAAYDALPVTVRRALDAAPFEICCVATLAFHKAHNAAGTIAEIEDSARAFVLAANPGASSWTKIGSSSPNTATERLASGARRQARLHPSSRHSGLTVPTVAAC